MRKIVLFPLAAVITLAFSGCSSAPKMFWGVNEGAKGSGDAQQAAQANTKPALEVPPELRGKVELPEAEQVATQEKMPERYQKQVAGARVALDAKVYDADVATVFSAVVDGMTALNLPVNSVDSPSGTVTTDWVRTDANNANGSNMMQGMNLFSSKALATRYRYVARVMRLQTTDGNATKTRLEVRTIGQSFVGNHWVNKDLQRKYADELFSRVEERLSAVKQ